MGEDQIVSWTIVQSGTLALRSRIGKNPRLLSCYSATGALVTDERPAKSLYQKVRLYSMLAVALIAVIVIFQNTEDTEVKVLFWTVTMPRPALLGAAVLMGFAAGAIWSGLRRRR